MPTLALLPLGITAGVVAFVLLWPRMRSGPAVPRLAAEMAITTLALSALLWGLLAVAQRLPW